MHKEFKIEGDQCCYVVVTKTKVHLAVVLSDERFKGYGYWAANGTLARSSFEDTWYFVQEGRK